MSRFTKAAVIDQIRDRAEAYQKAHGFNLDNGTSQLLPKGADEKLQKMVDRAVDYGVMRALEKAANDIETGHLGVPTK